jgi:aldehyde:ferredoxin oxidoreductase
MGKERKMELAKQFGRLLNVDMSSGQCSFSPYPEDALEYIGGRGFNIWYLYHNLLSGTDPLAPENVLLLSCGLLTGSSAPASARLHLNGLSPLTGILGSSNIGGYAGAWLRSCDIASIIVTGKSEKPACLYIDGNGARLEDGSHLWGCDAFETQDKIKQTHENNRLKILTIGPAGENSVRFASIMTERDHAAGRTGMGAIMGSKNLKAIVIAKGNHKYFSAVKSSQEEAVKTYLSEIRKSAEFEFFSKHGGAGYVEWVNGFGIMGSRNYSRIGVDHIEKIDARQLEKNIVHSSGCFRCPVQCKADLKLNGKEGGKLFTRPEFEPVINLGPKCGLDDLNQIIKLDNLCGRLGMDSTSAATVMAFAMDLFEREILAGDLAGELDLSWGNAETMEILLHQMVENRGLGKILRLGVREAAVLIGNGASKYAAHVKGLEMTAYHPAAIMGTALGYAVSSRGGDYNNVYASLEYSWTEKEAIDAFGTKEAVNIKSIVAKGKVIKKAVTTNIIVDSLGLCKVPVLSLLRSFNLEHETDLINGLTGLNLFKEDLFEAGEKIASIEKLFNIRHAREDITDGLPQMFISKEGEHGLTREKFNIMLAEYYNEIGWDENGIPPIVPSTLK